MTLAGENSNSESPTHLKIKVRPNLNTTSKKGGRFSQLDSPTNYLHEWDEEEELEEDEEEEPMAPDFSTHNMAISLAAPAGRNRAPGRIKDPF